MASRARILSRLDGSSPAPQQMRTRVYVAPRNKTGFLNVDLEIRSRSQAGLDELAAGLGKSVSVLYSGPVDRRLYLLSLELSADRRKGPDAVVHALCLLIEKLAPGPRQVWKTSQKHFDVGYKLDPFERSLQFTLRVDTLQRVASLGAHLAVTCYNSSVE